MNKADDNSQVLDDGLMSESTGFGTVITSLT